MQDQIQYDLLKPTHQQRFDDWVHTDQGREVANRFIRIAWGVRKRGLRIGAKAIWERLRWHYEIAAPRQGAEAFKLNNVYTAYMARFAMDREPALQKFFETRAVGRQEAPRRAVLVSIGPAKPLSVAAPYRGEPCHA
jgi:hypothetical protein